MEITEIMVPSFVYPVMDKARCERCERSLEEAWITAAGVQQNAENLVCFFMSVRCRHCECDRKFLFGNVQAQRDEWWIDIWSWFGTGGVPGQREMLLARLPVIAGAPLLFHDKKGKVSRLGVVGAYRGDAGPVLVLYKGTTGPRRRHYGVLRLERQDGFRWLDLPHDEALPVSKWPYFATLRVGAQIHHQGRSWIKMSRDEVQEIVCDRVFKIAVDGRRSGR